VLDAEDRVLLLRFRDDPHEPAAGHGWCTPGGGVEAGETLAQAAARELREEIGLYVSPAELGAPVAETSGYAELDGAEGYFEDHYFHYRVSAHDAGTSGPQAGEAAHHAGHRWWPLPDLAATKETVYPFHLAPLTADLVAGRVPPHPIRLPWQR
jgi:8-oxo-dGTP pyrophosphatase MutT (NUDIX family)